MTGHCDIGCAKTAVLSGRKIRRGSWNAPGQYVYYVAASARMGDYQAIHPARGPDRPWVPSISDFLAEDWEVFQ